MTTVVSAASPRSQVRLISDGETAVAARPDGAAGTAGTAAAAVPALAADWVRIVLLGWTLRPPDCGGVSKGAGSDPGAVTPRGLGISRDSSCSISGRKGPREGILDPQTRAGTPGWAADSPTPGYRPYPSAIRVADEVAAHDDGSA